MDLTQKSSESPSPASEAVQVKTCADCETTRTPLWRSGPAGPRSLCNACGIRQRKRRRALLGLGKGVSEKMKKKSQSQSKRSSSDGDEMGVSVNVELVELGRKMVMQRSWGRKKKMMREEEEAAMLLMALSCGSVFA